MPSRSGSDNNDFMSGSTIPPVWTCGRTGWRSRFPMISSANGSARISPDRSRKRRTKCSAARCRFVSASCRSSSRLAPRRRASDQRSHAHGRRRAMPERAADRDAGHDAHAARSVRSVRHQPRTDRRARAASLPPVAGFTSTVAAAARRWTPSSSAREPARLQHRAAMSPNFPARNTTRCSFTATADWAKRICSRAFAASSSSITRPSAGCT